MTTAPAHIDQPPLALDPLGGRAGPVAAALARSVAAARQAGRITGRDDAAVAATQAVAASLDQAIAYGATLETVVKGTTALRAYLAALNLTPASREDSTYDDDHDRTDDRPAWVDGAGQVSHPSD